MLSVSIVIPAFNELGSIERTMREALEVARDCAQDHEVIALDDGSSDGTYDVMLRVAHEDPIHVRVLRHETNCGIAQTFEDLYAAACKDVVFLTSGDGQFPVAALHSCLPLLASNDIVICRRRYKHYSIKRRIVSALYRWLPWVFFGIDLIDPGSVKCVKREVIVTIPVRSRSVFVEAERIIRAVRCGYQMTSIDISPLPRFGGKAGGGRLPLACRAFLDLLRCWWALTIMGEHETHR